MRRQTRHPLRLLALTAGLLTCTAAPAPLPAPDAGALPALAGRPGLFSGERAWRDLEALAAVGPRSLGSEGAARAREYIAGVLTSLGLEVVKRSVTVTLPADPGGAERQVALVNLEATIAGASPEWIVLAAPYDAPVHGGTTYPGVNDGASGAALLLELARVLVAQPLPYAVRLYFLDGEGAEARIGAEGAFQPLVGSTVIAEGLRERGELADIRLLLYLNRVSDADLRIARDRFSHRLHRDAIWLAAADLGHGDVFPAAADYEAPFAGHRSFNAVGMRRTVAIVDPSLGEPGAGKGAGPTEDDTLERSAPRSLEIVGRVTLAGLEAIATHFRKIDRFADAPSADPPATRTAAPPGAGASQEPAGAPATGGAAAEKDAAGQDPAGAATPGPEAP